MSSVEQNLVKLIYLMPKSRKSSRLKELFYLVFLDRLDMTVVIALHLRRSNRRQIFSHFVCEHDREHCFADDAGGGDGGDVGAFEGGVAWFLGVDIDACERFAKVEIGFI